METSTYTTTASIEDLGYRMAARGIEADPANLLLLARTATDLGVSDVLVDVMVDDAAPEVVRMRAFARVSVQVAMRLNDDAAFLAGARRELQHAC